MYSEIPDGAPGGIAVAPTATSYGAADAAFFSDLGAPTRFILIRHGQSEGNARAIMQGLLDLPLDDTGRSQAAQAGKYLATRGVKEILASPQSRAVETARILAQACRLGSPSLDPLLRELDTGIFTGLSMDEAREKHPAAFADFKRWSWDGVPGAERSQDIYERAMRAWEQLASRAREGSRVLACVTHGGLIQWLVRASFGSRSWMPLFRTGNCGVFELYVEPGQEPGDPAYLQWERIDFRPYSAAEVPPVF